jgi:hypothetical protein
MALARSAGALVPKKACKVYSESEFALRKAARVLGTGKALFNFFVFIRHSFLWSALVSSRIVTSIMKWTWAMADALKMVNPTKYAVGDCALLAACVPTGHCRAFRTQSIVKLPIQRECNCFRFSYDLLAFFCTPWRSLPRAPRLLIDGRYFST